MTAQPSQYVVLVRGLISHPSYPMMLSHRGNLRFTSLSTLTNPALCLRLRLFHGRREQLLRLVLYVPLCGFVV